MKLLLCAKCDQVFSLSHHYQECRGGHGGGIYLDNINAAAWGPSERVFVLGFLNSTVVAAVRDQIKEGDSKQLMRYAGGMTPRGREFTAFVMPDAADSVMRYTTREAFEAAVKPRMPQSEFRHANGTNA